MYTCHKHEKHDKPTTHRNYRSQSVIFRFSCFIHSIIGNRQIAIYVNVQLFETEDRVGRGHGGVGNSSISFKSSPLSLYNSFRMHLLMLSMRSILSKRTERKNGTRRSSERRILSVQPRKSAAAKPTVDLWKSHTH